MSIPMPQRAAANATAVTPAREIARKPATVEAFAPYYEREATEDTRVKALSALDQHFGYYAA